MGSESHRRHRGLFALLLVLVVALGLASRVYGSSLPALVSRYAGDTLWATAVFVGLALVRPAARTTALALGAALLSLAVELSQLAHPAWLETLRSWPGVALLIGYGFVWSDLACYAAGVALGVVLDLTCRGVTSRYFPALRYQVGSDGVRVAESGLHPSRPWERR